MTNRLSHSMGLLKTVTGFLCPHLPNIAYSPSQSHFDTPSAPGIRRELPPSHISTRLDRCPFQHRFPFLPYVTLNA